MGAGSKAITVAMLLAVLVGCSAGGDSESAGLGTPNVAHEDSRAGSASQDETDQAAPGAPQGTTVPSGQLENRDRKLARTAQLSLRVPDVDKAAADARAIAAGVDGYTGSERTDEMSARLTLTVPGDRLDAVLDDLEKLGKRLSRAVNVEDVTDKVVDVESRVASQRKSIERVRKQFDKAESIEDIMAVERELSARETELESLLARQSSLKGRVAMAPIHLSITADEQPEQDGDDQDGFLAGLAGGWAAFTTVVGKTLQGIGAVLPFAVTIGIPLVLVGWRLRRKRATA